MNKRESEHIVAYLDLLGASEYMKENKSEEVLCKISNVFYKVKEEMSNDNIFSQLGKIKINIFSDNIAFSREIYDKSENSNFALDKELQIANFMSFIAVFQARALNEELLFRGGISIGNLYVDESIIWGKALVDAVTIEEKVAVYPRIVISENVMKKWISASIFSCIKCDFDKMYFVDYLNIIKKNQELSINVAKKLIQENSEKIEKIKKCYGWLENYIKNYEEF